MGWNVLENLNQTSLGGQFKLRLSQRVIYTLKELKEFTCDEVNRFQRKLRENRVQALTLIYPSCNLVKVGERLKFTLCPHKPLVHLGFVRVM